MSKSLGMTMLGAAALAAATLATAGEPGGHEGRGARMGRHRAQRITERLGLTEEQQATWKSLHEQHQKETAPLRQEGRELFKKLRESMDAENPDTTAVGTAALALKEHREKIRASRKAFHEQLLGVLTPEQKAKFEELRNSREGRRGERGKRGPGEHRRGPKPQA
jgi:periplasmic protein CpxP/Spy